MDLSLQSLILLPIGLGLLGFIEPCTIGGHLLFLNTQKSRERHQKIRAVTIFIIARTLVAGLAGAIIAWAGQTLITLQTGIWLIFGLIYLAVGLALVWSRFSILKSPVNLAPAAWKKTQSPLLMGLAFGLNIPACAAPILFGLLALAATTGTAFTGFVMMALFGLFLSLPLAIFAIVPAMAARLDTFAHAMIRGRWIIGLVFAGLGIWSIWFGLYVDPQDWSGL